MGTHRDIPAQVHALAREALTGPLRRMLQSDTLQVLGRQVQPLGGGFGNSVSLGVCGITGNGPGRLEAAIKG